MPYFPDWHNIFITFLGKVKTCLLVKEQNQYKSQYIAVAGSAGYPSVSVAVVGVVTFQTSWVDVSIICSYSKEYIFWTVFLELQLGLVIRGQLKTVDKSLPSGSWQSKGCPEASDRPKCNRILWHRQSQVKINLLYSAFRQSIEPTYLWL